MCAATQIGVAGAVNQRQSSSSSNALNTLTLQTILDQQRIIERQQELVNTLKHRVEELEQQQVQGQQQRSGTAATAAAKAQQNVRSGTVNHSGGSYTAEMQLQRRLRSAEAENTQLKDRMAELQSELSFMTDHFQAQELNQKREAAAWRDEVRAAETKAAASTQLLDAISQRAGRLTEQVEKLRREVEVRRYEGAQWRSLACTIVQHLDATQSRYAKEQMLVVEDSLRQFSLRQAQSVTSAAAGAPATKVLSVLSKEAEVEAEVEESRHLWSRKAQTVHGPFVFRNSQLEKEKSAASASARFLTSMNAQADAEALSSVEAKKAAGSAVAAAAAAKGEGNTTQRVVGAAPFTLQRVFRGNHHYSSEGPASSSNGAHQSTTTVFGVLSRDDGYRSCSEGKSSVPSQLQAPGLQSCFTLSSQVLPSSRTGRVSA